MDATINASHYNNDEIARFERELVDSGIISDPDENTFDVDATKVKTNVPQLDDALGGGFAPGLHCVTGGPSSYKSAFLLQVAYMAALDGKSVNYITDEISAKECWQRLAARKMQVDRLTGDDAHDVPSWSLLEDAARVAMKNGDARMLRRIAEATREVQNAKWRDPDYGKLTHACFSRNGTVHLYYNRYAEGYLSIDDMGAINSPGKEFGDNEFKLFEANTRYIVSAIQQSEEDEYLNFLEDINNCKLLIIDAVNSLRLFEHLWDKKRQAYYYRDHMPEPRTRMEEIVTTLDNWSRKYGIATVGVFHGNRTRGQSAQHPSMGDFKETSAIEYRAVSAIELARADDMHWTGHPKAPFKRGEYDGEAVGVFVLKSRKGRRTEENKPVWLVADGAHNLLMPLDMLRR